MAFWSSRVGRCRQIWKLPLQSHSFSPSKAGFARNFASSAKESLNERHKKIAYMSGALVVIVFGVSYAAVPLYKMFCQMTGFGGTTQRASATKAITVKPVAGGRIMKVDFDSNVHDTMPWKFKPTQKSIKVIVPGETALAFYTAKNNSNKAITGVATYNVFPPRAGASLYFHKIQCFCFEQQRLGPGEEIDMPVFFFIDPEILDDKSMDNTFEITLSYTFFKTDEEDVDEGEAGSDTNILDKKQEE